MTGEKRIPRAMTLTQKEIADTLGREFQFSVRQSQKVVSRVLQLIKDRLASADDARCELRGLGVLATYVRPARSTVHPKTGEPVHIPERRGVRYRCSKQLRERLNPPQPKLEQKPARRKKNQSAEPAASRKPGGKKKKAPKS